MPDHVAMSNSESKTWTTGFRFAEPMKELIIGFAEFLGISRTKLVGDALVAAANMHTLGTQSLIAAIGELSRRYGADAPITIRVVPGGDGKGEAIILIDGLPVEDVLVALSVDENAGYVHVFADVVDWFPERLGTVQLGGDVLLTRPLRALTRLPWPPDETLGMVARLGELEQQPQAGRLVSFQPVGADA
jgi:hypothetical protein